MQCTYLVGTRFSLYPYRHIDLGEGGEGKEGECDGREVMRLQTSKSAFFYLFAVGTSTRISISSPVSFLVLRTRHMNQLTNRRQFSMVYTHIDHKMTSKNVQNSKWNSRAAGEWFHCQVLDILWRHFMVYKSIDHRKLPSTFFFTITWKKYERNWLFNSLRKRARYI